MERDVVLMLTSIKLYLNLYDYGMLCRFLGSNYCFNCSCSTEKLRMI